MSERMLLCLRCSGEFPYEDGLSECPGCHDSRGVPADTAKRKPYVITPHELHCLVVWAERFAASAHENLDEPLRGLERRTFINTVHGIARRLQEQYPDDPPLTFAGELQELRKEFGDVEVYGFPEDEE